MKRWSIISVCGGRGGGQQTVATPIDLRCKTARIKTRGKCFLTTIQSKTDGQPHKRKDDDDKKEIQCASFQVMGRKEEVGKKKTLFFSIRLAPFVRVYGGRNSRHKSCCRPRQKTCLNYKVTRKNNQKRWPLLAFFPSSSHSVTTWSSLCAPPPSC